MAEITGVEQVPRTDLEEAKRRFDAGSSLFVDVRSPDDYRQGHIPGAISIPLSGPAEAFLSLPRHRDVILY